MTWIRRPLIVAALACALPLSAMAQDALAKRVSLDLKAMAPSEAFKVLAEAVGTKVTVDPAVTASVDILVRNVSARTALNTICESIGCSWASGAAGITVRPGGDRVDKRVFSARAKAGNKADVERLRSLLRQPLPAGMKFENAPLSTVAARVSEALENQVTISCEDPAVQTITADISNMTLMAAINTITDQAQKRGTIWRISISDADGQKTRGIAIMIGGVKKKAPRNR